MRLYNRPPYLFADGELLDPVRCNQNAQYVLDAAAGASELRYARSVLPLRFWESASVPYTQADSAERRSWRMVFPKTVIVERVSFAYADTAVGTTISVNLFEAATGLAPAGFTNPWVSCSGSAGAGIEVATADVRQVTLQANVQYRVELTAAGTFSAAKAELVLSLLADRLQGFSGFEEAFGANPDFLDEQDPLTPTRFLAHAASVIGPSMANLGEGFAAAYKPSFFQLHGLTSGTASNVRRWDIPLSFTGRRKAVLVGAAFFAVLASAGAAGQQVVWQIQDSVGAVVATFTMLVDGLTLGTLLAAPFHLGFMSAVAAAKSTPGSDYRLVVSTNGATTILKTYCYLLWE